MIDHSDSVRDTVGLINNASVEYDVEAKKLGVKYSAAVDDEEIASFVKKGKIRDVSIGFEMDPICSKCGEDFWECPHWFDEAHVIATNMNVYELSLVTRGADPDAHVSASGFKAQFSKKLNKEHFNKEDNMTEKKEQAVDLTAVFERTSAAEKLAEEQKLAAEKLAAELAEVRKEKEELAAKKAEIEGKLSETKE
jgi:phage head maturation protease